MVTDDNDDDSNYYYYYQSSSPTTFDRITMNLQISWNPWGKMIWIIFLQSTEITFSHSHNRLQKETYLPTPEYIIIIYMAHNYSNVSFSSIIGRWINGHGSWIGLDLCWIDTFGKVSHSTTVSNFPLHRGIHIITKGQRFEGSERQINHQIKI